MIAINDVISLQTDAEKKLFIEDLDKRNKRTDTKNILLYRAYLKGEELKIKEQIGVNAFNALKKRLTDHLIEFTSERLLSKDHSTENEITKLIVLSRKLFYRSYSKTAFTLLFKAEKFAIDIDHFSLLNEIYHLMIEHSHLTDKIEQAELFSKLEKNNKQFLAEEKMSILYASMKKQFISARHGDLPKSLKSLYEHGLKQFDIDHSYFMNFKSLNQLCSLTDLFGSQTKNYHQLDLFFEDSIKELKGTKKDNAQSVYYQIELYYGLANIYFRKKNLEQSLSYLMQMEQQMLRLDQKYFSHWQARFCNLKALNLNFEGQSEAAENLLSAVLNKKNLFEKEEALLKLTLAMVCFQQGELEQVKTLINTLNRTDQWYLSKMGNEWLFNLKAIEILLHMDLGNDQLAESRLLSFQRKLPKAIKADKGNPLWPFIKLVKSILFNNSVVRTEEFVEKVERTIPWKGRNEDIFNICFYGWLKAKMINRPVYPTTLEIMKSL